MYSIGELRSITENLRGLLTDLHGGTFQAQPHDLRLLCELHERIFRGVRRHAGRIRRRGEGSETLTFGPHRSAHRDEVEQRLSSVFSKLERSLRSLDDNTEDPAYEASALQIAIWAHAEVIRIHPFEDGNGRSSRAFLNAILVRQGLSPIAVDALKDEYIATLNHYFSNGGLQPLLDLFLRLASDRQDELRPPTADE